MVKPMFYASVLTGLALGLLASCGGNCAESVRLGDFERSQGNLENAERHYEQALAKDPGCVGVEARLREIRQRPELQPGYDSLGGFIPPPEG